MKNPMDNKTPRSLLILVIVWALVFPALISATPEELRHRGKVAPSGARLADNTYGLLELSDEVLGQTRETLPDLRLYRGEQEIPFALVPITSPKGERRQRVEMFNQGRNSLGDQIAEVKVPETQWINGLVLVTADKDFIRKVKIEGSMDQKEWRVLQQESTVFDLTREQKSRNTEVNFPKTNLSFLRITLINEGHSPLQWEGVDLLLLDPKEGVRERKERAFEQQISEQKGVQEFLLKLKYPNLPVDELEVMTEDQNFSRQVKLYGSQTGERWDLLTQGELYDYKLDKASARNLRMNFQARGQFYKLQIYNQDNQPLRIRQIILKGSNPTLVFQESAEDDLSLYWGSSQMRAPQYDLEKFLPNLDSTKMRHYVLQQGEQNPKYRETDSRPWTERHSGLLNTALVLVVFSLLGIIVKSVKGS